MKREPAVTVGTITALATAVLALLAVFGLQLDSKTSAAVLGVVTAAAPILAAFITRRHVTPVAAPEHRRDEAGRARPLFTLLIAAAMAVVFVLGMQTYAQASITKSDCQTIMADDATVDQVCMVWKYHAMAGAPGISVDRGTISYSGLDMQSVDCYSIRIKNANGVTTWVKQGGECDVPSYPPYLTFVPIQDMPQSDYATVVWSGNANLKLTADRDFTFTMKLTQ